LPNLWKFLSKTDPDESKPTVEAYQFQEAEELVIEPEPELSPEDDEPETPLEDDPEAVEQLRDTDPLSYAQIQSDLIIKDAERRAEEILRQAEESVAQSLKMIREEVEKVGYEDGYRIGLQRGEEEARKEIERAREELADKVNSDIEAFIQKADLALEKQLEDNLDDLRDLALAVAEKVVCVSLKSSSDVICRMIQTAVDKRKRREWAHIYIAECDARRLTSIPASLTTALSELSDRVRIIPMADDEAGTCIIESPDEIIDASASTQLQNIRELLDNGSAGGIVTNFNFAER